MRPPKPPTSLFSRRTAAFSLFEVLIAMGLMTVIMTAVLASFVQTRRLAAASVAQNCAVTIVQGYIEQLKNIPLQNFINADAADPQDNPRLTVSFELPTMKDQSTTPITLFTTPSTVATSLLTGGTPGVTPLTVIDNLQAFDMDSRAVSTTNTWATIWPGARTFPATTPGRSDLRMNFWVQISDLTPTATAKCKAYGILIVYTWQYTEGSRITYYKDSIRTIRSAVQTF